MTELQNCSDICSSLDAILFCCVFPAAAWSAAERKILAKNAAADRFFEQFPGVEKQDQSELDRMIPDWNRISTNGPSSRWMDFYSADGSAVNFQTRNSCLDAENGIWLTVIPEETDKQDEDSSFSDFLFEVERKWTAIISADDSESRDAAIAELGSLVSEELNLTDFGFLPSGAFYGLSFSGIVLSSWADKKYRSDISEQQLSILSYPASVLYPLNDGDETKYFYNVELKIGNSQKKAGFFYLEGLQFETEQQKAERILSFLSLKLQEYYEKLKLENAEYLASFENALNDSVISAIDEGVIITDGDFSIMNINRVASLMFGFSNSQVVGHQLSDLLVSSEGLKSLANTENPDTDVKYLHRRSGEMFPCRMRVRRVESDGCTYLVFIISDETETEDSRLKTEQLAQRAFLGDFASLMAHEIRNPVNNMRIWLANIMELAKENEAVCSAAKRIDDDCLRISELVTNILSFSKPISLNKEEIDLGLLISEVIEKWRLNFVRKNITCYFTPPENFPKFFGDPRSLEQVLVNLISNSVDALGDTGGVITMKLSIKESESGRKQILITESDNGPGIPSDKIEKIFEPFMTTKKNGNGWGLAISKRIITSHKGMIRVNSFSGGTVFEILLPLPDDKR